MATGVGGQVHHQPFRNYEHRLTTVDERFEPHSLDVSLDKP
jgi:hypothetical protein